MPVPERKEDFETVEIVWETEESFKNSAYYMK